MAANLSTTTHQLTAELAKAKQADVHGALKNHLKTTGSKKSTANATDWPEGMDRETIVREITRSPCGEIHIPGIDGTETCFLFASGREEEYGILSIENDIVDITTGLKVEQVSATFQQILRPQDCSIGNAMSFRLNKDDARAFFAAIDYFRMLAASSVVNRSSVPAALVSVDDLFDEIKHSKDNHDHRSLSRVFGLYMPTKASPTKAKLTGSCKKLEEAGFLASHQKGKKTIYEANPVVLAIALDLLIPLPALILNDEAADFKITLSAGKSLWLTRIEDEFITFENITPVNAATLIDNVIRVMLEKSEYGTEDTLEETKLVALNTEQKNTIVCGNCSASLKATDKFCSSCGEKVGKEKQSSKPAEEKKPDACKGCGKEFRTSKKFCTHCGLPR